MHPFATDSPERVKIVLYIAILSVFLSWGISKFPLSFPWWFESPSVILIFYLIFELFNRFLWRYSIFKYLGVEVPDLNGEWKGKLRSSYDNHNLERIVKVTIEQNWREMGMILTTDQSKSRTLTSSLLVMQSRRPILIYNYFDEPRSSSVETMHSHRGTGFLELISSDELEGEYYTGRDRLTFGAIKLKKI
jgi:hypothetical protein